VRVAAVLPDAPAGAAGIARGDRRVAPGGAPVAWAFAVKRRLVEAAAGAPVALTVEGPAGRRDVSIAPAAAPAPPGEKVVRERLGIRAKPVTGLIAERTGLPQAAGVFVVRVDDGGPAARAGLQAGDVIERLGVPTAQGGRARSYELVETRTLDDLAQLLGRIPRGVRAIVFVVRDGRALQGEVDLP
jgi:S1-C subfamily serine protease